MPWTEEPRRLQSIKSQRVRHDWSNLAVAAEHFNSLWFQRLKSQCTKINISFTIFSFSYALKFYYLLFWQKTSEATKQSQFYPLIIKIYLHHFSSHGHFFLVFFYLLCQIRTPWSCDRLYGPQSFKDLLSEQSLMLVYNISWLFIYY